MARGLGRIGLELVYGCFVLVPVPVLLRLRLSTGLERVRRGLAETDDEDDGCRLAADEPPAVPSWLLGVSSRTLM